MSPSKSLAIAFAIMIALSVSVVYWNTLVMHDFIIVDDTEIETIEESEEL
jgi:TnpA family transposase